MCRVGGFKIGGQIPQIGKKLGGKAREKEKTKKTKKPLLGGGIGEISFKKTFSTQRKIGESRIRSESKHWGIARQELGP